MRVTLPSGTAAERAGEPGGPFGLVVIPDIHGLRPLFDDLVARLHADHAWPVLAVEPWPGREHLSLDDRLASVGTIADDRVLADLAAAADHLGCARTGVLGFCMGGMYTLKAAGTGRFVRAVSFYGMIRIPEQWRGGGQGEPLDYLDRAERCPTLAVIGGRDSWTPPADVEALEALGVTVVRYPAGEHGFVHDPGRPTHRPADAADAWQRAIAFLGG